MLSIIGLFGFALSTVLMTPCKTPIEDTALPDLTGHDTPSSNDFVYDDNPSKFADKSYDRTCESRATDAGDTENAQAPREDSQNPRQPDSYMIDLSAGSNVNDYDPQDDQIEVVYDPANGLPELTISTDPDGVSLLADGTKIAYFAGLGKLDLDQVVLVQG